MTSGPPAARDAGAGHQDHCVGLDIGTTAAKGVAVGADGSVLAVREAGYPLCTPRPGWSEQDPEDWWRAAQAVLAELRSACGVPAAIGLSGQMHSLVALDGRDRVLRPAILWNDGRTEAECREIEDLVGREELIELTGNRALAGFTASKLLWLRRHEPEVYGRIARICLPKDYVRLRLCGAHVSDLSDASGTLLLDVAGRRWSREVLAALALDAAWLPGLAEGPALTGETADGVVVAAGGGDQAAGAIGVGVVSPGRVSVVLGTSGVVFSALPEYRPDPEARLHTFCHAVPGTWHAMGVMLSAAESLRWLARALGVDAARGLGGLIDEARAWPAGSEGLLFLPYLSGERTPHADPSARAAFAGLSARHDRGALVRSVLEGVAFGLRDSLDLVRGLGQAPAVGRVSGGGSRSELWLRILASVLEIPLERVAVQEGAAFGAALLGGVAVGVWPDVAAAADAAVRVRETVEPADEWVAAYAEALPRFRALYPAVRGVA